MTKQTTLPLNPAQKAHASRCHFAKLYLAKCREFDTLQTKYNALVRLTAKPGNLSEAMIAQKMREAGAICRR